MMNKLTIDKLKVARSMAYDFCCLMGLVLAVIALQYVMTLSKYNVNLYELPIMISAISATIAFLCAFSDFKGVTIASVGLNLTSAFFISLNTPAPSSPNSIQFYFCISILTISIVIAKMFLDRLTKNENQNIK